MLKKRILSGVIFIPIVAFLIWWEIFDYPIPFLVLVCLITALLLIEFYRLASLVGAQVPQSVGVVLGLLWVISAFFKDFLSQRLNPEIIRFVDFELLIYLSIFIPFVYQIIKRESDSAFSTMFIFFAGTIYIGWSFGKHLILTRNMSVLDGVARIVPDGTAFIFLFIAIIWCSDTGAYAVGKSLGKHKLIPAISPGKTVEGSIGGLLFGALGGVAIKYAFLPKFAVYHVIILGCLLGVVGQISDLGESLLKRDAGVKDSGNLIPGHGGIFDRCDSMIFTAPVFYYYLKAVNGFL